MSELLMEEAGLIEYNDQDVQSEELNGRRFFRRKRASKRRFITPNRVNNSRVELAKRLPRVAKNIQDGLAKNTRQSVDTHLMVIKPISGNKSVKLFEHSDDKQIGYNQVHQGQLQKEEVMVVTAMTILYGTHSEAITSPEIAALADWQPIPAAIRNGVLEFKADNKTIIPEMSLEVFAGSYEKLDSVNGIGYRHGNSKPRVGYYEFANPKMLPTQTIMDLELSWGAAAAANTAIKVILHGSRVYKR